MPTISGVFDCFDNLDQISAESIVIWLKPQPNPVTVENYLANRILYPNSLPMTTEDMRVDLAILREALRINSPNSTVNSSAMLGNSPFLNIALRKLLIPVRFLHFFQDIKVLTWAFIDALLLNRERKDFYQDVWTIYLTGETDEIIGSVILPQFTASSSVLNLSVFDKKYKVLPGSLTVIPCPKERCQIAYEFHKGSILGKSENSLQVYGGRLGLMIDGRKA